MKRRNGERYLRDERIVSIARKVEVVSAPELNVVYDTHPDCIVSVLKVETATDNEPTTMMTSPDTIQIMVRHWY